MTRFSLSNRVLSISHEQFVVMMREFAAASESAFGSPCALKISVYSAPAVYTTYCDAEIEENLDHENAAHLLLATSDLEAISAPLWASAQHVAASVYLKDSTLVGSALGSVEFLGSFPRSASFYADPQGEIVKAAMLRAHPNMRIGDGFAAHGRRSGASPSSWRPLPL
jgi:hypothetical protein